MLNLTKLEVVLAVDVGRVLFIIFTTPIGIYDTFTFYVVQESLVGHLARVDTVEVRRYTEKHKQQQKNYRAFDFHNGKTPLKKYRPEALPLKVRVFEQIGCWLYG